MATVAPSHDVLPQGRHTVQIGDSLRRALHARGQKKASSVRTRTNNDFYAFKYGFRPQTIDGGKPGSIEADRSGYKMVQGGSQTDEVHGFSAPQPLGRDWECVLIYDEATGTFTLEKLDLALVWSHTGKATNPEPTPLALPSITAPSASQSLPTPPKTSPPMTIEPSAPPSPHMESTPEEEELEAQLNLAWEEEQGDEDEDLESVDVSLPQAPVTLPTPPAGRGKGKGKRVVENPDVEEMEFGEISRPEKRLRSASPVQSYPPAPPPVAAPMLSDSSDSGSEDSDDDSDSEDEMVPVDYTMEQSHAVTAPADGLDEEEFDDDLLADLNGVFDEPQVEPEPAPVRQSVAHGQPMSLNAFAGGVEADSGATSSDDDSDYGER